LSDFLTRSRSIFKILAISSWWIVREAPPEESGISEHDVGTEVSPGMEGAKLEIKGEPGTEVEGARGTEVEGARETEVEGARGARGTES
jgi:hypothetical protein